MEQNKRAEQEAQQVSFPRAHSGCSAEESRQDGLKIRGNPYKEEEGKKAMVP